MTETMVNDRLADYMAAFAPALRVVLLRMGVNDADVDDILSLLWERTWRHLAALAPYPYAWLLVVARHLAIDHNRGIVARGRRREPPHDEHWWGSLPDPAPGPADLAADAAAVADLLGRLTPAERAVMIAVALDGETLAAAGRRCGRSDTWAFLRRAHARQTLAAVLATRGAAA